MGCEKIFSSNLFFVLINKVKFKIMQYVEANVYVLEQIIKKNYEKKKKPLKINI